jgi:hypothetical protein
MDRLDLGAPFPPPLGPFIGRHKRRREPHHQMR